MQSERVRINRLTQAVRFVRVSRLLLWTLWVIYRERRRVIIVWTTIVSTGNIEGMTSGATQKRPTTRRFDSLQ